MKVMFLLFMFFPLLPMAQVKYDTSVIGCGEFTVRQFDSITGAGMSADYYAPGKLSSYYTYHWPYQEVLDSAKAFHRSGRVASSYYTKEGNKYGTYTTFYKNGQVKTKGQVYNDFVTGIWKEFYSNGKLKTFREFTMIRADSVFNGTDTVHKAKRKTILRDTTEYGWPLPADTLLYPECKDSYTTSIHSFIESDRTGVWLFYNEKGKITRREKYKR